LPIVMSPIVMWRGAIESPFFQEVNLLFPSCYTPLLSSGSPPVVPLLSSFNRPAKPPAHERSAVFVYAIVIRWKR